MALLLLHLAPLLLLLLLLAFDHAFAQQNITESIYKICNPNTFSPNSSFSSNLNKVLAVLSQQTSSSLYSHASSISNMTSSSSDNAYAVYQCRGDLSFTNCSMCVSSIIHTDPLPCGSVYGLRIQLLGCYFRYEAFDFQGLGTALQQRICSPSTNASSSFQNNLASVLTATANAAPSHGGFNASSQISTGGDSAYALAQCLGYLTQTECVTCLANVSSYNSVCPNSVAGQVYYDTCYYVYSNAPVLLSSTGSDTALTSPATNPAISPRIPTAGFTSDSHKAVKFVVVGIAVGIILLGAVGALFLFWRRKQTTSNSLRTEKDSITSPEQKFPLVAKAFSLDELRQATGNFNSENKLGEGGFGPVYKGRLRDKDVAIKMLSVKSHQGNEQFLNEVNLITNVQHRNLVELLGCCVEDSERLLVYEYLPKRSLNLHLFDDVSQGVVLRWGTRKEIIIGIARGLIYLHDDSKVSVVHRDIKASNILLDDNFNPKIADFGLARLFPDDATHVTTRVAGTMGYVAPDYATNGKLTKKADVYSFGLVTLEIVSGRRINDERLPKEEEQLLGWTWALYERQQQLQILDPRIGNVGESAADVIRVVHVALLCTQTWPGSRPSMFQVYAMLCGKSEILPLPTKPTHIYD